MSNGSLQSRATSYGASMRSIPSSSSSSSSILSYHASVIGSDDEFDEGRLPFANGEKASAGGSVCWDRERGVTDVPPSFSSLQSRGLFDGMRWNTLSKVLLVTVSTASLCLWFRCPSTLFFYLSWLVLIVPVETGLLLAAWLRRSRTSFAYQLIAPLPGHDGRRGARSSRRKSCLNTDDGQSCRLVRSLWLTLTSIGILIWVGAAMATLLRADGLASLYIHTAGFSLMAAKTTLTMPSVSTAMPVSTVFIAINLYNSAHLFPRFSDNLIDLVDKLGGRQKVFVSLYESNSNDGGRTVAALDDLAHRFQRAQIPHAMVFGNQTSASYAVPSANFSAPSHLGITDDGNERIAFLADVRNRAMQPFYHWDAVRKEGAEGRMSFDKVLWLNDVVFEPDEVRRLVNTNAGLYDAACAFDYMALGLYDTWVTRDIDGLRPKPLWPYFAAQRDVRSLIDGQPILVDSCWNGAISLDARWFRDAKAPRSAPRLRPGLEDANVPMAHVGADVALTGENHPLPLRFRNSRQCLASECLLLALDMHRALKPTRPVIVMNPQVVTAYDQTTFLLHHGLMRWSLVQPWRWFWERQISARLFRSLTDLGRSGDWCFDAFRPMWSDRHAWAHDAVTNEEVLHDVMAHRWSDMPVVR